MKKLMLVFALALIGHVSFAQDSFKDDTMKLLSINGSSAGLEVAKKQVIKMIPEAKHAEFSKDFDATLPSFYEKMAKVMMEVYSHDEIKDQITFYESPVGKKMAEKAGEIQEKAAQAGQEWGMELQGMVMKYME